MPQVTNADGVLQHVGLGTVRVDMILLVNWTYKVCLPIQHPPACYRAKSQMIFCISACIQSPPEQLEAQVLMLILSTRRTADVSSWKLGLADSANVVLN